MLAGGVWADRLPRQRLMIASHLVRLVSQAGLALGLSVLVEREFPTLGVGFRALSIAMVALNEMFGPILFKLALDRAGETSKVDEAAIE